MSKKLERQKTSDNEFARPKVLYQQPIYSRTTSSLDNLKYGKPIERNFRSLFSIFEDITGTGPKRTKSESKIGEGREYKQLDFESKNTASQVRQWGNLSSDELKITNRRSFNIKNRSNCVAGENDFVDFNNVYVSKRRASSSSVPGLGEMPPSAAFNANLFNEYAILNSEQKPVKETRVDNSLSKQEYDCQVDINLSKQEYDCQVDINLGPINTNLVKDPNSIRKSADKTPGKETFTAQLEIKNPFKIDTKFNWELQNENVDELLDMKKFIFSDKVEAAVTTQKTLEKKRKISFERMNLISKQPKSLELISSHLVFDNGANNKVENVSIELKAKSDELNWPFSNNLGMQEQGIEPKIPNIRLLSGGNIGGSDLKDSTELHEAFSNLSLKRSIKRNKSYKDSHINISSRNSIELEHIVELQEPGFVKAVLNLSSEPSDVDAEDINGNIVETMSNELSIKGISVDSAEFDPVLPDQSPPEMIFQIDLRSVEDLKKPASAPVSLEWNIHKEPNIMRSLKWFKSFLKKPKKEKEYPKKNMPPPNRLELCQERAVYTLSHLKLSESHRSFYEQVLITNLMLYILSVHSDVTIHGRGPRRHRKKKGRRRKPRIPAIEKKESENDSDDSVPDEDKPGRKAIKPLINFEENDDDDDDDDVPLAILKKKS